MRAARLAQGLGLRDLALQVGMSASSLSEFEHGKSVPGQARLGALATILEVPLVDPRADLFEHWRDFASVPHSDVEQAALDVFLERGYEGATIRLIADRCGMSVSGVYHHTEGKYELLVAILRRAMDEVVARAHAAADEATSPQQRLTNLVECLVRFSIHRRASASLVESEVRSLDALATAELWAVRRALRDLVADAFASCRGDAPAVVPDVVAGRAIVTMCVAIADWYLVAGSPNPDQLARHYAALALAMVPG